MKTERRRGFTMMEILIVLVIITILAALLLPVFFRVRAKSREAVCASNLHQIGLGVLIYTQDYDDLYPRGGDPTDINTDAWKRAFNGEFSEDAKALRPLPIVMQSYVKNPELWHCPADTGFDYDDTESRNQLNARPTSFDAYGSSYYYRTELTLRRKKDLVAYDPLPPHAEHGASDINMLFDGTGSWHGGKAPQDKRYNVLMADGHVKNMTLAQFHAAWNLKFELPPSAPPAK